MSVGAFEGILQEGIAYQKAREPVGLSEFTVCAGFVRLNRLCGILNQPYPHSFALSGSSFDLIHSHVREKDLANLFMQV